jgi:uncharacterized protein (UPF0548 family)
VLARYMQLCLSQGQAAEAATADAVLGWNARQAAKVRPTLLRLAVDGRPQRVGCPRHHNGQRHRRVIKIAQGEARHRHAVQHLE